MIFKIDFNNRKYSYLLKENNLKLEGNLKYCNIEQNEDIILEYKLEDELKKIIIQIL